MRNAFPIRGAACWMTAAVPILIAATAFNGQAAPAEPGLQRSAAVAEAAPYPEGVTSLWEAMIDTFGEEGPQRDAATARAGPPMKGVDGFLSRKRPNGKIDPELVTERSRLFLETDKGHAWLEERNKLEAETNYDQVVDALFAGDDLALVFVVSVPRPTDLPKRVRTVHVIRHDDQWRVSLDIAADVKALLGRAGRESLARLEQAGAQRQRQIVAIVTRPLEKPLPLTGTWYSSGGGRSVLLSFTPNGEVTIYQHREGQAGMQVADYQVFGDVVLIETMLGPMRLVIDRTWYREHDGQKHYRMMIENARRLWPDAKAEPWYVQPLIKGDWPVRRPVNRDLGVGD
ncbi:MAG: hypothetical protein HYX69_05385 [Planctomycetia bacterium]|nr:hypothetical protein [Planctomycetia bacterium]